MTAKEFNDKYREYTETGFDEYGPLEFDIPTVTNFLDDVFENILTKIPGFQVTQIKLKFNQARFYNNTRGVITFMIEDRINNLVKYDANTKKEKETNT